jgi:lysophospholipase L1-like esterase
VGAASGGGYPERLYQRLKREGLHVGILNLAKSGATSIDVVREQVEHAARKRPHLVTLGVGNNDLWRLVSFEELRENLERIADVLAPTGARVVVSNVIDLSLAPAATAAEQWLGVPKEALHQRAVELNRVFDALAKRPRFTVVDLFGLSRREVPGHPEYFCSDGFHPSELGYERWADLMWPAVERASREWLAKQTADVV